MAPRCPEAETLQEFLLGRLPADEVERLARHVEQCARCVESLQNVRARDPLLEAMQTPLLDAELPTTAQIKHLIEQGCALRPTSLLSGARTFGALLNLAAQPEGETTQEVYDFLAPAQNSGEMGRLGPYRVLKVLGTGGMGVVFQAEEPELLRLVALKVLRPGLAASAAARRRFLREAQAIASLQHDHIVSILQVGEDRSIPYLAMPLLQGETLDARLQREPMLPLADVLRIGREIAEGLAAAHEHGFIHRDIKPSNIWLEAGTGRVKILDFGLARAVSGDANLTHSGVIVGTPAYMAPEQVRGEKLDARCDLFSLGCVLYRLCTGQQPFPGAGTMATLRALELQEPRPPQALRRDVPRAFSGLILQLLAKRPEDRLLSARAVIAALDAIRAGKSLPRPAARRQRRLVMLAAVLTGLLVLATGWFGPLLLRRAAEEGPSGPGKEEAQSGPTHLTQNTPASFRPCHFALQATYEVGVRPYAVAVGNFNGDRHPDLAVSNIDSNTVSVLLGNGDGTFQKARAYATGSAPHSLVVADFDRDGKQDLAVVNLESNTVSILRGNGDGSFQAPVSYPTGAGPRGLAVGDVNGDGKLDLVTADQLGGTLSVLLGRGDGTFESAARIARDGAPISVALADVNGDGRLDLVASLSEGNQLTVFLGNGDGTFGPPKNLGVGSGPGVVVVADFNGDGHSDLAVENFGSNDVSVLLGNGDGTFRAAVSYGAGWGPGGLAAGDFNGDGVLDLVVANHGTENVSVLLGRGDGTFQPAEPFAAGSTPAGLAVADLNGDGKGDVIAVNYDGHNVSVLLGRPPAAHFRLSTNTHVNAAISYSVVVAALDAANQPDSGYTGSVRLTSSDPQATIPEEITFAGDNGVQSRPVIFRTAGAQTLIVTDERDPERYGALTVRVDSGMASHFRVTVPTRCEAGKAISVTVTALDGFNNVDPDYRGTVHFSSTDEQAVLPGDYTFVRSDRGVHRFDVTLKSVKEHTLTVTDTDRRSLGGSAAVRVMPANGPE